MKLSNPSFITVFKTKMLFIITKKTTPYIIILVFPFVLNGCKPQHDCFGLGLVPTPPYSNPIWYPDGSLLGFNHQPLKSVQIINPCRPFYLCDYYLDSIGFWLINKDGSNKRRTTDFNLDAPAWSPDGKWIAFCNGGQIYKMPFDGSNFDTTQIYRLTNDPSNHFFPSWSPNGDTIYYDCNKNQSVGTITYWVWKMASDGTGQTEIGNKGIDSIFSREPYCAQDDLIFHIRGDSMSNHVYSMDANGNNVRRITNNISKGFSIRNPNYFDNKVFFQDFGIWSSNIDGTGLKRLCPNSTQRFSISPDGTIAYVNFSSMDTSKIDRTHGSIWLIDANGNNNRPFTFNYY